MSTVNLENLLEGHVVAKDVVGRNDAIIIPAGTVIQAKHFRILKIWGIHEIEVTAISSLEEASLNNINTTINLTLPEHMKRVNPEDPFISELINIILKRRGITATSPVTEAKNGSS